MALFNREKSVAQKVTHGQMEIERDGKVAFLEYNLAGKVLQLLHTEVPPELRGHGLAGELAKAALDWAREQGLRVDVICPFVAEFIKGHPEYADLVLR